MRQSIPIEKLVGMEAQQAIQAGDVSLHRPGASADLVKRGEEITVVSQGGGIRVRTTARARRTGAGRADAGRIAWNKKNDTTFASMGSREAAVFYGESLPSNAQPSKSKRLADTVLERNSHDDEHRSFRIAN